MHVFHEINGLRKNEKKRQAHDAEDLETDPGFGREMEGDIEIGGTHQQEKYRPAQVKSDPHRFRQLNIRFQHAPCQVLPGAHVLAGEERNGERPVDRSRLPFDEALVLQQQSGAAKYDYQRQCDDMHGFETAVLEPDEAHLKDRRGNSDRGGKQDPLLRVVREFERGKERQYRKQIYKHFHSQRLPMRRKPGPIIANLEQRDHAPLRAKCFFPRVGKMRVMTRLLRIHPEDPQPRLLAQAAAALAEGAVIVYPTDSCYALGCRMGEKDAQERIRRLRGLGDKHDFTLVCRDLSDLGVYSRVDNAAFRFIKTLTPGPYTFILRATHEVPRRLQNPRRKTIGLRVPDNRIAQALLAALGEPLMSTTLQLPGDALPLNDPDEMIERMSGRIDMVIDAGSCGIEPTTVIDLVESPPKLVRQGKGPLS